jgi:hypothetical protein
MEKRKKEWDCYEFFSKTLQKIKNQNERLFEGVK